jgi:hypothetical protein
MPTPTKRINAWSSPRNISTALMYSFAQRPDTTVVDEPLYAHYLTHTKSTVVHPGEQEILNSQHNDGGQVIESVILGNYSTPVVFFKQMTHHLILLDDDFLSQTDHIILIRPPRAIINSYIKVIDRPSIDDIGVARQLELFRQLQSINRLAAVVECEDLLRNPAGMLSALCQKLQIRFEEAMLSWPAGPRPEDGIWAKYWYHNVHRSTGFLPYTPRTYQLPDYAETLAQECQPYYDELYQYALQASE